MGSKSSKSSSDNEWKNEIYFDPQSDSSTGADYRIKDYELMSTLAQLIDSDEKIEKIWIYSHRLYEWQLYQGIFMYHVFIVLETNEWFWSIEKNAEGITIQRSKHEKYVKYMYRRSERITPITERSYDSGRMRMADLINWLYKEDELNYKYEATQQARNCQGFAKRIFNHFASTKLCGPLL